MNYDFIAKTISDGLMQISEPISLAEREMQLSKSPDILERVADLYSHIFLLLNSYMDWIMRRTIKRTLDSFKKNFTERFDDQIRNIRTKARSLRHMVEHSSRRETYATRQLGEQNLALNLVNKTILEDIRSDQRIGREGAERAQAELEYRNKQIALYVEDEHHNRKEMDRKLLMFAKEIDQRLQDIEANTRRSGYRALDDKRLLLPSAGTGEPAWITTG